MLEPGDIREPTRAMRLASLSSGPSGPGALTKRESEVVHWLSEGKRDREIACIIGVSPRTVHHHVEHILRKLCVETRTAAARLALAQNSGRPVPPR